jgi:GT2 family glycosyltransferase
MNSADVQHPVSVVMAAFNNALTIAEQLEALSEQAGDCHEIVVVDNGSTDDTRLVVQGFLGHIPNLRIVDGTGLRGIARVRNYAAASSVADLVCCDADDVVAPGWIRAMASALEEYDVVGGRIEETFLNGPSARPRTQQATELPMACGFLPFAIGANSAVRREVLDHLDGWDPRYRRGGEDVEMCWRAQLAGYRIGFAPDAVVHYRHRSTATSMRQQQKAYGYAQAMLHRDFRARGLRRGSVLRAVRPWGRAVALAPLALKAENRLRWQAAMGFAWGTGVGMFGQRAWPYSRKSEQMFDDSSHVAT